MQNNTNTSGNTRKVRIFDTTLRDGEQTPGVHIHPRAKLEIAKYLEDFGVTTIEAGYPASSPGDSEAVARIARTITRCEVTALARCKTSDIDAVVAALRHAVAPVVHIVLGVSDIHLKKKIGITRHEALQMTRECVSYARAKMSEVQFSVEDATRADRAFLRDMVRVAVDAGATRINVPDTVGCTLPEEFASLIAYVIEGAGPDAIVSAHCHNDMGLATANSIAAVQAGARQVEVAVNGIGERAGNTSIEEVGVVLAMKDLAHTGLDLTRANALSAFVAQVTGVPVQPNRAIVGANAFAHSSGIHQDGILKDPKTYEFVPPRAVGVAGHRFILTARSGRAALVHHAASLGIDVPSEDVDIVYREFLRVADASPGAVSDEELRALVGRTSRTGLTRLTVEETC